MGQKPVRNVIDISEYTGMNAEHGGDTTGKFPHKEQINMEDVKNFKKEFANRQL
jgi:hypothetical protein